MISGSFRLDFCCSWWECLEDLGVSWDCDIWPWLTSGMTPEGKCLWATCDEGDADLARFWPLFLSASFIGKMLEWGDCWGLSRALLVDMCDCDLESDIRGALVVAGDVAGGEWWKCSGVTLAVIDSSIAEPRLGIWPRNGLLEVRGGLPPPLDGTPLLLDNLNGNIWDKLDPLDLALDILLLSLLGSCCGVGCAWALILCWFVALSKCKGTDASQFPLPCDVWGGVTRETFSVLDESFGEFNGSFKLLLYSGLIGSNVSPCCVLCRSSDEERLCATLSHNDCGTLLGGTGLTDAGDSDLDPGFWLADSVNDGRYSSLLACCCFCSSNRSICRWSVSRCLFSSSRWARISVWKKNIYISFYTPNIEPPHAELESQSEKKKKKNFFIPPCRASFGGQVLFMYTAFSY